MAQKDEPSNRRKKTVADLKLAEPAAKNIPAAKHFDNETLARLPGTSGPSHRHEGEPVEVRTALRRDSFETKLMQYADLAQASGTSGPSNREEVTVQLQFTERRKS